MARVGLVVNPRAGMDVRRLTSLARTITVHERVNVTARILAGIAGVGVTDVDYVPEPTRVVERAAAALEGLAPAPAIHQVPPPGRPSATDQAGTVAGAAQLRETGAACVVTLGGDGTTRAVVEGWPDAVLVAVPGGTNNAFATPVEPVVAGYAAGRYAADPDGLAAAVHRLPLLRVQTARAGTLALVDVALTGHGWTGAHALWEEHLLVEAVMARSDPSLVGLAGVAGALHPLELGSAVAVHVRFEAGGRTVTAALGPGQMRHVDVVDAGLVGPGESVTVRAGPRPQTLALDGERDLVLAPGTEATITVEAAGPRTLDCGAALRHAASRAP